MKYYEGALAYIVRKRLNESEAIYSKRFSVTVDIYRCYERGLFDIEAFEERFLKKVRSFVSFTLDVEKMTNEEKVLVWKKQTKLNEFDLANILNVSQKSIERYKFESISLSKDLYNKIDNFFKTTQQVQNN